MTVDASPYTLIAELDAKGHLPADWTRHLAAVPREMFIPTRMWADSDTEYVPIDRAAEPDR